MRTDKPNPIPERRSITRGASFDQRRRYPRYFFDFDWFVESEGCSTLGRGLELSVRGALLNITCNSPFPQKVTLFVSMPSRGRMFKAHCEAAFKNDKGWVLNFTSVQPDDLQLLGSMLISEYGLAALPNLERKYRRFSKLEKVAPQVFADETP